MVFYLKTAGYLNKFFNLQCNVLALGNQSQEKNIQETNEIKNTYNNKFEFWFIEQLKL